MASPSLRKRKIPETKDKIGTQLFQEALGARASNADLQNGPYEVITLDQIQFQTDMQCRPLVILVDCFKEGWENKYSAADPTYTCFPQPRPEQHWSWNKILEGDFDRSLYLFPSAGKLLRTSNNFIPVQPEQPRYELLGAARGIPFPKEQAPLGEDSGFYIGPQGMIAIDGVGGLAEGAGFSSARFAACIAKFWSQYLLDTPLDYRPAATLLEGLHHAYKVAYQEGVAGAACAGGVRLNKDGTRAAIVAVGDCSTAIFRQQEVSMGIYEYRPVHFVPAEYMHDSAGANCPWQMSYLPDGRGGLGNSYPAGRTRRRVHANFPLWLNDFMLTASDGVWDNLFLEDVCELLDHSLSPAQADAEGKPRPNPKDIADVIAEAALFKSKCRRGEVPYQAAQQERVLRFSQMNFPAKYDPKEDDITVVCAYVVPKA